MNHTFRCLEHGLYVSIGYNHTDAGCPSCGVVGEALPNTDGSGSAEPHVANQSSTGFEEDPLHHPLHRKFEDMANEVIDEHHECGGGEDAHIIADEAVRILDQEVAKVAIEALEKLKDPATMISVWEGKVGEGAVPFSVIDAAIEHYKGGKG